MRVLSWLTLSLVGLILLGMFLYLIVGEVLFKVVFGRKSVSTRILTKDLDKKIKDYKIDLCWWDRVKFLNVETQSFDGLKLSGYFFDSHSDKTAIIVHGFGRDYREMQPYCKLFLEKNFNVLVVDNRAHGKSQGSQIGFGWLDGKDIVSWIEYLNKKQPSNKIVLFGLSMGGTAVCSACGENLPDNVVAAISDCAFANADKQIQHIMRKHKFLFKMVKWLLYSFSKRVHNFDIMQIDVTKKVKNSKIPILFIHGDADDFVPIENLHILFSAAQNKDKFVVENAQHAMSYAVAGVLYEKKISDFLKSRTILK